MDEQQQNHASNESDEPNHANTESTEPTAAELLRQIIELRRENEQIRQKANEAHNRANEAQEEHAATRREAEEARQRMEDTLQEQGNLRRANGDLLRRLQDREERNLGRCPINVEDQGHPFSATIMAEQVPLQYNIPKLPPYAGSADLESQLKVFNAQILVSGGSDVVRCKVFVGTLSGAALKWFSGIPRARVTSFPMFAKMFLERFVAN